MSKHRSNRGKVPVGRRIRLITHATQCALCGVAFAPLVDEETLDWRLRRTIDHITEVSEGGASHEENLQVAHKICNMLRGAVTHLCQLVADRATLGLPPIPTQHLRTIPMTILGTEGHTLVGLTVEFDGARRQILHVLAPPPGELDDSFVDVILSDPHENKRLYQNVRLLSLHEALRPTPAQKQALATFVMEMGNVHTAHAEGTASVDDLFQVIVAAFEPLARAFV